MVEIEGQNERLEFRNMGRALKHACVATLEHTVIAEMNADSHVHLRHSLAHS